MAARVAIGEFSVMTGLSKKALRHYHELGLLEPAHVDRSTGYRFYDTAQVHLADVIRRFRELGMPVPEVKAILATEDVEARNEIVAAHLRRMESQLQDTQEAVAALRELLVPAATTVEIAIEIRSVPATRAWAIADTVQTEHVGHWFASALDELRSAFRAEGASPDGPPGGFYERELFTEGAGGATLFVPTPVPPSARGRIAPIVVPAVDLAIATHHGSHAGIDRTYGALGTYVVERLIPADGPVRETYLDGDLSGAAARTEIGWPIFRTSSG